MFSDTGSETFFRYQFLSDPGVLWSDLCVVISVSKRGLADLTDMTLADEDTDSILADHANGAF